MREILFRGKHDKRFTNKNEWIYGVPYIDHEGDCLIVTDSYRLVVTAKTVGQYTGFIDKNGNKIFEGDIVAFDDCTSTESGYCEQNCRGEVIWDAETASFQVTGRLLAESYEVFVNCIIIGNIHDNPDLLKGE